MTLLRWALAPIFDTTSPFITYYAMIALVAAIAGFYPGLLATLASAAVGLYLFEPLDPSPWVHPDAWVRLGLFAAAGLAISIIAGQMHRALRHQRQTTEHLREREDELRLIMDSAPALISYIYADGHYGRASANYQRWFGLSPEQIHGRHAREVLGEEAWRVVQPYFVQALRGEVATFEHEVPYRHGGPRWVHVTYIPDRDQTGHVRGVVAHVVDISDLRESDRALRYSEQRLRVIFDKAALGIVEMDEDDHFVAVNDRACRILGYDRDEMLCMNVHGLTSPEDRARSDQLNADLHAGKMDRFDYEKRYLRHDGAPLWVHVTISAIRDDHGCILRSIGTFEDISERKKTEEDLLRNAEELRRSNQDLEQFAYVASHDLQEPLRMVSGFLSLLYHNYRHQLDAKSAEYVEFAIDGATRMQQLIQDLLKYSRAGQKASMEPLEPGAMVQSVLSYLKPAIQETEAVVTVHPMPPMIGDRTQLAQVFQNLIVNALKFRRPDIQPEIQVGACQISGQLVYYVRDNGIGIPEDQADRVFMVFQRLHPRGHYPGTGIGLAIVKRIIENHSGKIWVESTVGQGSAFYFTLGTHTNSRSAA